MRDFLRPEVLFVAGCCLLLGVGLVVFERGASDGDFCRIAGIAHREVDGREHGDLTLVVNGSPGARDRCDDGNDLIGHDFSGTSIEGVVWSDCIVSWRNGGRTTAADIGYSCVEP